MTQLRQRLLPLFLVLALFLPNRVAAQETTSRPSSFPVPAGLESAVQFWKNVFTEYSAAQLIFFDPVDMSNVYEVVEVGEDNRTDGYINGERERIAAFNGIDIERVKAQRGIKERTAAGIKRSGRYLAQIQQIFRERGLPPELTYLPIVESSYDIGARSSVGAVGVWQFMPRTGREYMRVGAGIDERRDPLESSRAAASYLQQAYDYLGSWPLAITSYNYGQAGMARAVAAVDSDNLVDLIQNYTHPNWGFAPKQFYAEFLAAVEIGSNPTLYYPGLELDAPAAIKEVEVTNRRTLAALIASSGLSRDEFLGWNPALHPTVRLVPAGYRVKLPHDRTMSPLVEVAQISAAVPRKSPRAEVVQHRVKQGAAAPRKPPRAEVVQHRVKQGETLFQIAERYGASVQRILQVNGIRHAHFIKAGTMLRIPRI